MRRRRRRSSPEDNSPAGVLQEVALDGRRHRAVVVAHADVGAPHFVHGRDLLQGLQDLVLTWKMICLDWSMS